MGKFFKRRYDHEYILRLVSSTDHISSSDETQDWGKPILRARKHEASTMPSSYLAKLHHVMCAYKLKYEPN